MSTVPEQSDIQGSTVLIVDDNPDNLKVLTNLLGEYGIKPFIATNGEVAIARAKYVKPDIILLDILMPGIDGFETCLRLKADTVTQDIPVIFMTALKSTEDKVRGFRVGAVDYISKPFEYEEILARITTHIRIRMLTRDLSEKSARLSRRTDQLRLAAEVARDASSADRLGDLLIRAVNMIQDRFEFHLSAIFILDERGEYAFLEATAGNPQMIGLMPGTRMTVEESNIIGSIINGKHSSVLIEAGGAKSLLKQTGLLGNGSEIALALQVSGRIIGILYVLSPNPPSMYKEEVWILKTLADQLAVALEKTSLFEQMQTALEQRLRIVVSNAPVAVFALDRWGKFTLAEGKGLKSLGLEPSMLIGQSVFDIWQMFPGAVHAVRRALVGETFHAVIEMDSVTLATFWSTLRNAEGEITCITIVATDITERVRVEREREVLIKELETRNIELERYVYTVSHDLKTPLISIKGLLGVLEQDMHAGDWNRIDEDIYHIVKSTDTMYRMLNELLDLTRIGRIVNPYEKVSLLELAREAVELHAGLLRERGVQTFIASDLPVVLGDRPRLFELLQNLLENATKYMGDQPEPQIEIGMRYDDSTRVFYVRDNGLGIKPIYQKRIFGLFEKLDPNTEGVGVGLAIVKRIVDLHNGRIWVESEGYKKGSTFCFTIGEKV